LQKAFRAGHGQDKAARDPDLAGIRNHPMFKQLVTGGEKTNTRKS
jgi:hypothetical protein